MKKILAVFLSTILLTWGVSADSEAFATTVKQEKQEIINDLEDVKNQTDRKKTKKVIDSAIKQIEKSLEDKLWKDDSTLNLKPGKKALNADKKAVNKLDNILKDNRESESIKERIVEINEKIAEMDKELVENAIESLEEVVMSKKGLKKLDKATNNLEKGEDYLEDGKYVKAIKNFGKSWDQIKKALKDPHFKKLKLIHLEGTADLDYDDDKDIYLKILKPKKPNKPYQVEIKMTSECLKGNTHDTAGLKIGFSGPTSLSTESFHEEFNMTNKWFKKYDLDRQIDTVVIDSVSTYFKFPETGDNFIQINSETMEGSFDLIPSEVILDEQESWGGKFQFTGEPGDYRMIFFTPTIPAGEPIICNALASFSIGTTFE